MSGKRRLKFAAVGVIALHVVLVVAVAFGIAYPNPFKAFADRDDFDAFDLDAERLEQGDFVLWLVHPPGARRVVLMCHGRSTEHRWLLPLAKVVAEETAVALFDFRGHGDTPYGRTTIGWDEADDVDAALDLLEREAPGRGIEDIVVFGQSMGAAAALRALARSPRQTVRGVVIDGAFDNLSGLLEQKSERMWWLPGYIFSTGVVLAEWWSGFDAVKVDPVSEVARVRVPVRVLEASDDTMVPTGSGQRLAAAAPDGRLITYSGIHDEPFNPNLQGAVTRSLIELR